MTNVLSTKAILVNLSISVFTGRRKDHVATDSVETTFTTNGKVGQYTKKLIIADELDNVQKVAARIRTFYYDHSLPWFSDGSRIIKSEHYAEFTAKYRELKNEYDSAVNAFVTAYPNLVNEAKNKLGALYNQHEYPRIERIQSYFNCEMNFMPVPDVQDFRVQIADDELKAFQDKMKQVEVTAMRETWNRLFEVVEKAATRLMSPDAIIRDSLIQNITEMCSLLPKLNITDDPSLETMRQKVESVVSNISPELVRESDQARSESAKALNDIMSQMGAFMGQAS